MEKHGLRSTEIKPLNPIEKSVTSDNAPGSSLAGLPFLCRELYYRYCSEGSESAFEQFYEATLPVFIGVAAERLSEAGLRTDPLEIVNRLYGILVSHTSGRRRVPVRVLLSWSFGVISNLVREEQRRSKRAFESLDRGLGKSSERSGPLERKTTYKRILRLLERPNRLLMNRERYVMDLFYRQGLTLKEIARKLKISAKHAAVILHRARKRLASRFSRSIESC